jgi:DNA helicase II / ATP-dependent DNA helicase PcrA
MFHADPHIHSKFSHACRRDYDIPASRPGHCARASARSVPATSPIPHGGTNRKAPLFRRSGPAAPAARSRKGPAPAGAAAGEQPVRFMLSVEIPTICRRDEHTRKVHHLIHAPTFEAADRIIASASEIGSLASDGRPILGRDSRDLLEITLEAGPGCYSVPAHIWTRWFAVLGSGPVSARSPAASARIRRQARLHREYSPARSPHELDVLIAGCLSTRQ